MLTGVFRAPSSTREQQLAAPPMEPIAAEGIQLKDEESVVFGCPKGCIKVYQSHSTLQRHLVAAKHLLELERESTYAVIKWAETCKSISGSYLEAAHPPTSASASVSHSQSEDAPPTADMGWALKKTKKSVHFTTKVRQFLHEVFLQEEDTGNKERPIRGRSSHHYNTASNQEGARTVTLLSIRVFICLIIFIFEFSL